MDRILIVDDNSKNIQILATVLAKNNYEVEYALRGKDAVELLRTEEFELILLDIMMPEMDGFETCIELKKIKGKQHIPIIFLTAKTDIESIAKGFEIGGVDYITKPFNDRELLKRMQTHLELKKSREKLEKVNTWLEHEVKERTKELEAAKKDLENANTELIRLDKTKTSFLSLISHEIRTPLNGISGFLYLLKKQNKVEGLEKYINPLDDSVRKLENFSTKALLLTEVSTSETEDSKVQELNLRELVLFAVNNLFQKINAKKISVNVDELSESVAIMGEDDYLLKCFEYVIENAIENSAENTEILIRSKESEAKTICEIIDNGQGFPTEIINNLDLFFSPNDYTQEKFGLSLTIVKKVMDRLGGSLQIENMKQGAKVSFEFKNNSK
ncbi:MAG: hybrid sensor histidine kinase/response regulator [Bacteroidales bacterium]|nr:hybrid sensor histidine kinase/response regulator [Bacteroidales bacterium]